MTAASVSSLQLGDHRFYGVHRQKRPDIAASLCRDAKGLKAVHHATPCVPDGGDVGTDPATNSVGRVSAGSLNIHDNTSSCVSQTYERDASMSYPSRCKKLHISHDQVEQSVGQIIRNRSLKAVAIATGRTVETVKKWRQTKLPDAWAAFANLLAADDDVFQAVMEMAGRNTLPTLSAEQRRAVAEALSILKGE